MKKLNFDYNLINNLYVKQKKSCLDMARLLNCSQGSISMYLKKYGIKSREFIRIGQIPWNKGKSYPLPHLKEYQFKKGHTLNRGKKLTETHKKNLSKSHKGNANPNKGKTWEEAFGDEYAIRMRKKMKAVMINTIKEMGKNDTKIEKMVENMLLFNNILYVKQFKYELGVADFWLPNSNLIIECDGDYWHSLPGYSERDENQTSWLENNDFFVLRFAENQIRNNFNSVQSEINKYI